MNKPASEVLCETRAKRLKDAELAARRYGAKQLYMHLSALSPSTRRSHADRHGRLFTYEEMLDWIKTEGSDPACKCSFAAVIVGDSGKPIVTSISDRAKATYEKMKARGYDWSK